MHKIKSCTHILLITFLYLTCIQSVKAQEKIYNITFESRNAAIAAYNKGCTLLDANQANESVSFFAKSIRIDSTLYENYGLIFKASIISKNFSDSILNYLSIGKRNYVEDNSCYYIAEIYRNRKQFQNAILEYSNAINLSESDSTKSFYLPYFFSGRAYCYSQLNSFEMAINDYSSYLEIDPTDAIMWLNRGVCYQKIKNGKKAVADLEKAVNLGNSKAKEYLNKLVK